MTCPSCNSIGRYTKGCHECDIRAVANSFEYFDSRMKKERTDAYIRKLKKTFGDQWEIAHAEIWAYDRERRLHATSSAYSVSNPQESSRDAKHVKGPKGKAKSP